MKNILAADNGEFSEPRHVVSVPGASSRYVFRSYRTAGGYCPMADSRQPSDLGQVEESKAGESHYLRMFPPNLFLPLTSLYCPKCLLLLLTG
jgi:hypothetical protein